VGTTARSSDATTLASAADSLMPTRVRAKRPVVRAAARRESATPRPSALFRVLAASMVPYATITIWSKAMSHAET